MTKILDILRGEYSKEYFLKKYTTPKIYPKVVTTKPPSSFSNKEKREILEKYPKWYIYYSFEKPNSNPPKMVRQSPIIFNVNRDYPDFDDRLRHIKIIRNSIEKILKNGYSPYESELNPKQHTAESALNFALELKKPTLKGSSFRDYENRLSHFLDYLKKKGLLKTAIKEINKKIVNDFLNDILRTSSPRNRNNTKAVLSALFTVMEDNDLIDRNFVRSIKKLKTTPKKNKAFSQAEITKIFEHLKTAHPSLYFYCAHIYYGLFRPIEVVRIQVNHINLDKRLIKSNTKTGNYYKQIPNILYDEFYSKLDLPIYDKTANVITRYNVPQVWDIKEDNKRDYFGDLFKEIVKDHPKFKFSNEYTLYSFRHSAIGKLFVEKAKELQNKKEPNFEEKALDFVRSISLHKNNATTREYLREIGYYKIEDWSELLK